MLRAKEWDGDDARARRTLVASLALVLALLATQRGEFWPFSINPMFSRAGRPFVRALVRELGPSETYDQAWVEREALPGRAFALLPTGVSQNDLSNFVEKTERWTPARLAQLNQLFAERPRARRLLVFEAHGALERGRPAVRYRALVELSEGGARAVAP